MDQSTVTSVEADSLSVCLSVCVLYIERPADNLNGGSCIEIIQT
jgi:hypothetical protein